LSFKLRNGDILLLTWVILAAECLQNENLKGASPLKPNKTGSFCEHFYKKILTSQKAYVIKHLTSEHMDGIISYLTLD
jgi:hypothetical protein